MSQSDFENPVKNENSLCLCTGDCGRMPTCLKEGEFWGSLHIYGRYQWNVY